MHGRPSSLSNGAENEPLSLEVREIDALQMHGVGAEGGVLRRGKWQEREEVLNRGFPGRKV